MAVPSYSVARASVDCVTTTVPLDAGVTVELPGELTPLPTVETALCRAWVEYTVRTTPPGERPQLWLARWLAVLFWLWVENKIELWARDRPSLDASLTLMPLPTIERDWARFDVDTRYGMFRHRESKTRFYDVHLRVKPLSADMPVTAVAGQLAKRPRSPGMLASIVPLLRKIWIDAGRPAWTKDELLRTATNDANCSIPQMSRSQEYRAARLAMQPDAPSD